MSIIKSYYLQKSMYSKQQTKPEINKINLLNKKYISKYYYISCFPCIKMIPLSKIWMYKIGRQKIMFIMFNLLSIEKIIFKWIDSCFMTLFFSNSVYYKFGVLKALDKL